MSQSSFALRVATLASCAVTFGLAACSSDSLIPTAAPSASASRDAGGVPNGDNNGNHFGNLINKVCPTANVGEARCHSWIVVDEKGQPLATGNPAGYGPNDLKSAYSIPVGGTGVTVAIVDAYDDPNAERDLGVYRAQFGLPACTTPNGCFKKVGQTGTTKLPQPNASWSEEISLDLDMVSAICPSCNILLVEANSPTMANLGTAVNTAAGMGAAAISNSYGGGEYSGETSDENAYFNHPGIAVTVSSGDGGYGVEFPAASRFVIAVGGTSLTRAGNARGWSETAWNGAGSGCSKYVMKPSWQTDSGCSKRTVADVSAVANPNTGVAVYDTYGLNRRSAGWLVFGGTSVASPIIASFYALAQIGNPLGSAYSNTASLFDVMSGSNGSCGGSYLCTAGAGYDGPTGLGTPNGTGAF
jgi:subtilase family serine protease